MPVTDVASGPARSFVVITKDDGANLSRKIRALDILDAGTVRVTCEDDSIVTTPALPAGYRLNCVIKKVHATGTSATSFMGFY